jgi:hypothetical protein
MEERLIFNLTRNMRIKCKTAEIRGPHLEVEVAILVRHQNITRTKAEITYKIII